MNFLHRKEQDKLILLKQHFEMFQNSLKTESTLIEVYLHIVVNT